MEIWIIIKRIYKKNSLCDSHVCGGLTHIWIDNTDESLGDKTICKRYCITHGKKAFLKIKEEEKKAYQNRNFEDKNSNTFDDIPF